MADLPEAQAYAAADLCVWVAVNLWYFNKRGEEAGRSEGKPMLSRAICLLWLGCLAVSLALPGCAPTGASSVWKSREASFDNYRVIEMPPVVNATGLPLAPEVPAILTQYLRGRIRAEDLPLADVSETSKDVLVVQSEVVVYEVKEREAPILRWQSFGGWQMSGQGTSRCTLRTRLVDKVTNQTVAEIVVARFTAAGRPLPAYFGHVDTYADAPEKLLQEIATRTAEEIAALLKRVEPN